MAKHPHKLILLQKKTWRCALDGCTFFVHLGLAHVLVGKMGLCWGCGEQFKLDELALQEEQPRCDECRSRDSGLPSIRQIGQAVESQGVETDDEVRRKKMEEKLRKLGIL